MQKILLVLLIAIGPVVAAADADSGGTTVYRWTDEYGHVQFGSHPPAGDAEQIRARNAPLPGGTTIDQSERQRQRQKVLDAYQRDREIRQADRARAAQAKQERAERCRQLQSQWRLLQQQRRLYTQEGSGEKHYLSESERSVEKTRTREAIKQACGRPPD